MTRTVDVEKAGKQLRGLLALALEGDDVIIAEGGKPLARLIPLAPPDKKRMAGLNRGAIHTSEDFDEPLPDEFWAGRE